MTEFVKKYFIIKRIICNNAKISQITIYSNVQIYDVVRMSLKKLVLFDCQYINNSMKIVRCDFSVFDLLNLG